MSERVSSGREAGQQAGPGGRGHREQTGQAPPGRWVAAGIAVVLAAG